MRKTIIAGGLAFGAFLSQASAQEERWLPITPAKPTATSSKPAGSPLGKPIVAPNTGATNTGAPISASSNGARPAVHQSNYAGNAPKTVIRGQDPEAILHPPRIVDSVMSPGIPEFDMGTCCCGDGGPHGPWSRWYGKAEYLIWKIKDAETPPLVTTSPQDSFGILGEPGTAILFGGDIDSGRFHGGRFTIGKWCDACEQRGWEASFFYLRNQSTEFNASSAGDPLLARPFFNVNEGFEDSQLIANLSPPGFPPLSGSVNVTLESELMGAEINCRKNIRTGLTPRHCLNYHIDGLIGFRWVRFEERLGISENLLVPASSEQFGGFGFVVNDRFTTENNFFGGQLGLDAELRKGRWFLNVRPKVAIGVVRQEASIAGSTQFSGPGIPTTTATGGLYALSSNIGDYDRNRFSVIPEIGVNLGYQVTDHLRVFVGYSLMYWFNVARPGEQIDRGINTTLLPGGPVPVVGPARPAFQFNDDSFWAQGVNFGFELRY